MKHSLKITAILILLFFVTQIIGLYTINRYITVDTKEDGTIILNHPDTVFGPQPEFQDSEKSFNFIYILIAVLVGTAILFLLIKFQLGFIWKLWFLMAIAFSLSVSLEVYLPTIIAVLLSIIVAVVRIFKPNIIVHNLSELFIYTGIAILILPFLNLTSGIVLLILISIYDMYAVWKSKHMVKLAEFQLNSKMFAGIAMNYTKGKKKHPKNVKTGKKRSNAILGGGDIAFPLFFSAAVMEHLIVVKHVVKLNALFLSLFVTLGAGMALTLLFLRSEKGKYYPAMPFISLGCFIGYFVILFF